MTTDPRLDETLELIGSDKVQGTPVKRPNGEHIGEIRRLMIDKAAGQVAYAVMNFGGMLSLGQGSYAVPWAMLTYKPGLEAYELDITDETLAAAPRFNDDSAYDVTRAEGRRVNAFMDVPYVF